MYTAKNLIGSQFYTHFLHRIMLQQLDVCECCANDLLVNMTSQKVLDRDPFDWFFDSVMVFIIAIFHDFQNSYKIVVSTESKKFFGFMIKKVSIVFWTKNIFGVVGTLRFPNFLLIMASQSYKVFC